MAIDIIVTIVTIIKGIAKLAQLLSNFTKWIDEVLARGGKGVLKVEEALQEAKRTKKLIGIVEYEILNPNLLRKYIDDTIKICKERAINLEIKMIDSTHPRFNEPDHLGGFRITNEKNKVILSLRPECPKITWHHERKHLEDFLELGWKRYSNISKITPWKHEESVWNYILKNRNKWSEPELVDAYLYYQEYVRRKTLSKIKIEIKEMEDLGKKLGLIK